MVSSILLQTSTGGSPIVVVLTLLTLLVTAGLSLGVAYLLIRGYHQNRNRARLFLGLGLVLLTTGPIVLQFVLSTFTTLSPVLRSGLANASKLLGLGAILYAIYGVTQAPKKPDAKPEASSRRNADRSEEVRE